MADDRPTPADADLPGGWPQTPASQRTQSYSSYTATGSQQASRLESHAENTNESRAENASEEHSNAPGLFGINGMPSNQQTQSYSSYSITGSDQNSRLDSHAENTNQDHGHGRGLFNSNTLTSIPQPQSYSSHDVTESQQGSHSQSYAYNTSESNVGASGIFNSGTTPSVLATRSGGTGTGTGSTFSRITSYNSSNQSRLINQSNEHRNSYIDNHSSASGLFGRDTRSATLTPGSGATATGAGSSFSRITSLNSGEQSRTLGHSTSQSDLYNEPDRLSASRLFSSNTRPTLVPARNGGTDDDATNTFSEATSSAPADQSGTVGQSNEQTGLHKELKHMGGSGLFTARDTSPAITTAGTGSTAAGANSTSGFTSSNSAIQSSATNQQAEQETGDISASRSSERDTKPSATAAGSGIAATGAAIALSGDRSGAGGHSTEQVGSHQATDDSSASRTFNRDTTPASAVAGSGFTGAGTASNARAASSNYPDQSKTRTPSTELADSREGAGNTSAHGVLNKDTMPAIIAAGIGGAGAGAAATSTSKTTPSSSAKQPETTSRSTEQTNSYMDSDRNGASGRSNGDTTPATMSAGTVVAGATAAAAAAAGTSGAISQESTDQSRTISHSTEQAGSHRESELSGLSGETGVPPVLTSQAHPTEEVEEHRPITSASAEGPKPGFESIKTAADTEEKPHRPTLQQSGSRRMTEEDVIRHLSRRNTRTSSTAGDMSRVTTASSVEEQAEIDRLMSRMFGRTRQAHSEEEKTRHKGVIFKNLTVTGMGLGAALQPTFGDVFLGLPRLIKNITSRGPRKAAGKPPIKTIIDDFSGCIRPGEMCLVLGRPGSGCSTFLKVLGNQRFGYESIEGDVTYGGADAHAMMKNYKGEVVYNPEDDLHYATLSVKNTLEFALKCKTPGPESRNEGETAKEYVASFLRSVVKLFWIEHTLGTKVGNEHIRGVSGGEKKRVSIAEAMITKASTQCWDNSTRGLDASTALEYVSSLRSLTNMAHISTAVALYQAGESLYECFDKVLLIDGGQCAYFGSADDAAQYFRDLGFVKPERWTTADFLTSVTDEHERHIKQGWENRIPRSADQFGEVFRKSEVHKRNLAEIDEFEKETLVQIEERQEAVSKATRKKNYTIPFYKQVWACTHRQFLVMFGDRQSLGGKWGGILFQALIVGSLFYDLPDTALGVFPRGGVLFFMLLFNALLALAELTSAFESRPILLKHKSFQFYRPAAYALAQTVVDVPLVFIQVFIFDIVVYFMSNLSRTASQFFISLLFLFILTMTMYAFFRAIGALVGSLDIATRLTGIAIQALVVYTGYLIPPKKMHPWFSWIRWINPIQYGFEALVANEFHGLQIQCVPPFLVPQGPNAEAQYQGCTIQGSQPGDTVVGGDDYIRVAYQYRYDHLWRNFGIVIAFFVFFVVLTAIGMEIQKPNKGGGAVTIYKRGQVPKTVQRAMDTKQEVDDVERNNSAAGGPRVTDVEKSKLDNTSSSDSDNNSPVEGVAKNETVFTWQNVNYTIPYQKGERKLLQNVNGFVRPGRLTALMGASGAGKTTLLNTLAQRINFGVVSGDFLVDGRPLPKSFQRSSGFAEQMDVHEPTQTVREALRFSAKLRQPKETPLQEKYEYCETILKLLEMESIAGATVGKVGEGLNQEQRKRLTIGVELASKPELLMFLDEPTSGLDSGAAFNIVRFLRKLADAGQAILCTIHQPSAVLFEEFDELILLKSGGRLVYHGDLGHDSKHLLEYFEGNGGKKCPEKENPAEYMLEVIGAGNPDYSGPDWADIWEKSSESQARKEEIQSMISKRRDASANGEVKDDREFAMPLMTQIYTVTMRNFAAYYRSQDYLVGKLILHIFTGLFNAFTFWDLGNSQIDMQSRLFSIFMVLTISPPLIQQLQPRFLQLRNIYSSRERNSKIYSWSAFVVAAVLPELPWSFLAGTLYWCCWYWPPHFPRDTYTSASVWLFVCLFEVFYVSFGQAIASFAPNELLASLLVPIFFLFVVSFCGVVVPYASLPYFWRSWMYWLTPFHYLLEGVLALVTHGLPVQCDTSELARFRPPPGLTCQDYAGPYTQQAGGYVTELSGGLCGLCQYANGDQFAASFNVYYEHVWRDYGIFWAYCIFNIFVVFIASWLFLSGGKSIKRFFSPSARREKKHRQEQQQQQQQQRQNEKA